MKIGKGKKGKKNEGERKRGRKEKDRKGYMKDRKRRKKFCESVGRNRKKIKEKREQE
jgi:hypothetical protein